MKKTIRLTGSDIKKMVMEALNEYNYSEVDGANEYIPSHYKLGDIRPDNHEAMSQWDDTNKKTDKLKNKIANYNGWIQYHDKDRRTHGNPKFYNFIQHVEDEINPIVEYVDDCLWHIKGEDRMCDGPYYNYTKEDLEAVKWLRDTLYNIRNNFLQRAGLSNDSRYYQLH